MSYILIVTGVPGTGKSTIGRAIASELGCAFLEGSELARRLGLTERDPTGRHTQVLAPQAPLHISDWLIGLLRRGCIVLATIYPEVLLDKIDRHLALIALLRVHPFELEKRLRLRTWPERKVLENLVAEATNYYHEVLLDYEDCVIEVDVTRGDPDKHVSVILDLVDEWFTGFRIDWLSDESVVEALSRWLDRLHPNENWLP